MREFFSRRRRSGRRAACGPSKEVHLTTARTRHYIYVIPSHRLSALRADVLTQSPPPARLGKIVRSLSALQGFQTADRYGGPTHTHRSVQPALPVLQSVGRERIFL